MTFKVVLKNGDVINYNVENPAELINLLELEFGSLDAVDTIEVTG